MSPRAAWRLEQLGFQAVYDYRLGKADWMAAGLPTIRADMSERRAIDELDRDAPTCPPDRPARKLAGIDRPVIVVNNHRIVLGRVADPNAHTNSSKLAEDVMQPGPTTVRAHEPLDALRARMAKHNASEMVVTTPDGELLGVVRR